MIGYNGYNKTDREFPFVSVVTPTFNRRPFLPYMIQCFQNQLYPQRFLEWIIVDDGSDNVSDVFTGLPVRYFRFDEKKTLGWKRNFGNNQATGEFIVYMDDDDYYPPTRISHAIEMLQENPTILCAGSSQMHLYFKHLKQMYTFGPYGPNHATAATFAFRRALLNDTRFDENSAVAEEKFFLKNYTIPMVQLNPKLTILVFSHIHNSFDKKILLKDLPSPFIKESNDPVEEFVQEVDIYRFFMLDIDEKLRAYGPGDPQHKPDVNSQIESIDAKRKQTAAQQKQYMDILQKLQINPNDSLIQKDNQTMIFAEKKIQEMSMVIDELLKENKFLKEENAASDRKLTELLVEVDVLNDKVAYYDKKIRELIASNIANIKTAAATQRLCTN